MVRLPRFRVAGPLLLAGLLAACAGHGVARYDDIGSTALMGDRIAPGEPVGARREYLAAPDALSAYRAIRVEAVEISSPGGKDFEGLTAEEVRSLADHLDRETRAALARRGLLADRPGAGVLRLRLVLVGAETTVPGIATLTRVTPVGLALNGARSAAGAKGGFTGSATYVAEFRDERTGALVWAFLADAYPVALDIAASLGRLTAAEVGIRRGAEALAKRLEAERRGEKRPAAHRS